MYSVPFGDNMDIITSSRRDVSENTTLTAASVIIVSALSISRSVELQMKIDDFQEMVPFVHVVIRGTSVMYEPKFEPKTLMLLKRCVAALNGDGAR